MTSDRSAHVLVIQNDMLEETGTRIVMPLRRRNEAPPDHPRLQPVILLGDEVWVALALNVATLSLAEIGPLVASAEGARDDVTRALDMVLAGV
ncbi:CcdB family protein [Jannaschia sp. W003]|uniref:CcdB family protein n=1 Tax=Jannaschia sp. W003 TaxID=2867012 RepID=UPI0021A373A2|nr:CcdB family protein [Jannaschia sp. W003]UWQ22010.1 CcdB family protein [Jannaschia sp. W003]